MPPWKNVFSRSSTTTTVLKPTDVLMPTKKATTESKITPPPSVLLHPIKSTSSPSGHKTDLQDIWTTTRIEIGITNIFPPPPRKHKVQLPLLFEISLRFPDIERLWRIQRSLADMTLLHTKLEKRFSNILMNRSIQLPKPSRMQKWTDYWASNALTGTASDPQTQLLLFQLGVYLKRIVEVDSIWSSDLFREFLTPQRTSTRDIEIQGGSALTSLTSIVSAPTSTFNLKTRTSRRNKTSQVSIEDRRPPPAQVDSLCSSSIYFGSGIQLRALSGLRVGLTKRSGLSGGHKAAAAVAAGVAGVALTGPLSAVVALGALGSGMGKYQLSKSYYVAVDKTSGQSLMESDDSSSSFIIESADFVSGPRRVLKFGDLIQFYACHVRKNITIGPSPDSKRGHLMISNTENDAVILRIVSPYGEHMNGQNITCGTHIYLQLVEDEEEYLGLNGEYVTTDISPTAFKICLQTHSCFASEKIVSITRPLPLQPFQLRVMAYNVWLMPSFLNSLHDKLSPYGIQRAQAIPLCLVPLQLDVVVFCEAFCSQAREILVQGMKEQGFYYETKVVGTGGSMTNQKALDGGCFAMSRYPLEHFEELTFGSMAVGDDRMADKGIIYFQVRVQGYEVVHVFGTHLQAWETKAAITTRNAQLRALATFIQSMKISPHDAVLIVGDMNVDQMIQGPDSEYNEMMTLLNAVNPPLTSSSSCYSYDPSTNELAVSGPSSGGRTERLDYVLTVQNYRQPQSMSSEIIPLKATSEWTCPLGNKDEVLIDLSDHYPVMSIFQY